MFRLMLSTTLAYLVHYGLVNAHKIRVCLVFDNPIYRGTIYYGTTTYSGWY